MKILFVCLGNICRSPMAESVFRKLVEDAKLQNEIYMDSAGTEGWHVGESSNVTMIKHASQRGYQMTHLARQVESKDFIRFDRIIAMDDDNYRNLQKICPKTELLSKLSKMTDFSMQMEYDIVPDPYYGTDKDFELVIDILEDSCEGLLNQIKKEI